MDKNEYVRVLVHDLRNPLVKLLLRSAKDGSTLRYGTQVKVRYGTLEF